MDRSAPWQVPPTPVSPHGLGDNLAHQAIRRKTMPPPFNTPKKWPGLIKGSIKGIMVVHKSLVRPVISLGGVKGWHWGGNYPWDWGILVVGDPEQ